MVLAQDARRRRPQHLRVSPTSKSARRAYRDAWTRSDEVLRTHDLSTLAQIANPGEDEIDSLRRIVAHMIEETGRHAGQCDILRELIDGVTDD